MTLSGGRAFLPGGTASIRAIRWAGSWHVEVPARRPECQGEGDGKGEEARGELPARVRALDFDSKCDGKPVSEEEKGSNLHFTKIALAAGWRTDYRGWGDQHGD